MEAIEHQVKAHEDRLTRVENDVRDLKEDLRSGLQRVDNSNQYLREQNSQILKEVIKRNTIAEQHDFEIQKLRRGNQLKMFGMIFGASGLAAIVIDVVLKLLK